MNFHILVQFGKIHVLTLPPIATTFARSCEAIVKKRGTNGKTTRLSMMLNLTSINSYKKLIYTERQKKLIAFLE